MTQPTLHNPDRFMVDLRQILSQGKKRIDLLIGAGAPVSIVDDNGKPLIPDVRGLTDMVRKEIPQEYECAVSMILRQLGENPNIEDILIPIQVHNHPLWLA